MYAFMKALRNILKYQPLHTIQFAHKVSPPPHPIFDKSQMNPMVYHIYTTQIDDISTVL